MRTQDPTLNLDLLQAQYADIAKRLKEAKKNRDARQRIAGSALLDYIDDQPDSGMSKTLVDLLNRRVTQPEDRQTLGLDELMKKIKAAAAASATPA